MRLRANISKLSENQATYGDFYFSRLFFYVFYEVLKWLAPRQSRHVKGETWKSISWAGFYTFYSCFYRDFIEERNLSCLEADWQEIISWLLIYSLSSFLWWLWCKMINVGPLNLLFFHFALKRLGGNKLLINDWAIRAQALLSQNFGKMWVCISLERWEIIKMTHEIQHT